MKSLLKKSSEDPRRLYLLGNPNVGKSTVFNAMTGLKQHTGNWSGKTVECAIGKYRYLGTEYILADLPGTHSVYSDFSEECAAGDEMCSNQKDGSITLILADATALKRGIALALEYIGIRGRSAVLCINLCDIAQQRGIDIDIKGIEHELGIPVIGITAKNKNDIKALKKLIHIRYDELSKRCEPAMLLTPKQRLEAASEIASRRSSADSQVYNNERQNRLDRIITSKKFGIPIMLLSLGIILWITIAGANLPSDLLSRLFASAGSYLEKALQYLGAPPFVRGIVCEGIYGTVTWVVSVMLPPMAIFFPLFTLLEDFGLLPRIAFNLDKRYAASGMSGKQCLTQCMGLGCNAVGVTGCKIMPEENQRSVAVITNSLTPCNGRFALLISLSSIFIGGLLNGSASNAAAVICMLLLICLSVLVTWAVSYILTRRIYKTEDEIFALELPEYRRPEIIKTLISSLINQTLRITGRAVLAAAPAGAVIWLLANIHAGGETLLTQAAYMLDPAAEIIGIDGFILLAFILSLPANETTLPILVMGYLGAGVMAQGGDLGALKDLLLQNGWTLTTAVCTMLLTLFHWPCATTLLTIYRETGSIKTLLLSVFVPFATGVSLCILAKYVIMFSNTIMLIIQN